ncbi:hypothetical protein [Evansella tamaricis]|uniref:Uncharacterized protein n=1 Tax=Evansella tamaricis TaxID=2069301 RepID=A0ABS6JHL3_9BACI|nr:hypothetical protein [Evansella tamaricis]MBU9713127.1 hypothetical protein [Evansella tamaricis]
MAKQKASRSQNQKVPGDRSVNPLGKSPDDMHAGEVVSQGQEAAKKSNTKR